MILCHEAGVQGPRGMSSPRTGGGVVRGDCPEEGDHAQGTWAGRTGWNLNLLVSAPFAGRPIFRIRPYSFSCFLVLNKKQTAQGSRIFPPNDATALISESIHWGFDV